MHNGAFASVLEAIDLKGVLTLLNIVANVT
jgi:hypothetical protein